jgi:hypothetical protein
MRRHTRTLLHPARADKRQEQYWIATKLNIAAWFIYRLSQNFQNIDADLADFF